jgi:hypothetical protein
VQGTTEIRQEDENEVRNDGMMKASGRGDLDFSALILLMEELAGIKEPFKS